MIVLLFLFLPCVFGFPLESVHFHDIYWNSSNPIFETFGNAIDSPGYAEINAKPHDILRFHCAKKSMKEFSVIYKVSQDDFFHCNLSPDAERVELCGPGGHHIFTHILQRTGAEDTNYYLTTSTGTFEGMKSRRLGLCLEKNMRLAVHLGFSEMQPLPEFINGVDIDSVRLDELYLAEENGALSWKKNVHPIIEPEEIKDRRMKFDLSRQIEPIPIDDEFVNRIEEAKRRSESEFRLPPDVQIIEEIVIIEEGQASSSPLSPISLVTFAVAFLLLLV